MNYQSHRACGFGYRVLCYQDGKYSKPVEIYRGEDAVERFIEKCHARSVDQAINNDC